MVRYGGIVSVAAGNGISAAVTERGELADLGPQQFRPARTGRRQGPGLTGLEPGPPGPGAAAAGRAGRRCRRRAAATSPSSPATAGSCCSAATPRAARSRHRPAEVRLGAAAPGIRRRRLHPRPDQPRPAARHRRQRLRPAGHRRPGEPPAARRGHPARRRGHMSPACGPGPAARSPSPAPTRSTPGATRPPQAARCGRPGNPDMYPAPHKVNALAGARIVAACGGAGHVVLTAELGPAIALRVTAGSVRRSPTSRSPMPCTRSTPSAPTWGRHQAIL